MSELSLFLRQLLRNPREISAAMPSSRALARLMASPLQARDRVAELGPGTGRITRAILDQGISPTDLTLFEINPSFTSALRAQFSAVTIHQRPAQEIGEICHGLDAVLSGLPLLSFPTDLQRDILRGAFKALKPEGRYIQFTYGPRPPVHETIMAELALTARPLGRIWANLPPATVYEFAALPH